MHLHFAGIACKIHFLMPSNFDEKMPLNYDKFCPLKMMAFMIIKGNIICWHFLKALPSAVSFHCILRAITVYFWDEVFSLGMPSFNNSVTLNTRGTWDMGDRVANCPPIVFCPQIWKTKKSSKIKGNTLGILSRSFFPFNALGMPSFNNSAHWINNLV